MEKWSDPIAFLDIIRQRGTLMMMDNVVNKLKSILLGIAILSFFNEGVIRYYVPVKILYGINIAILLFFTVKYNKALIKNLEHPFFVMILIYYGWTALCALLNGTLTGGILFSMYSVYMMVNVVYMEKDRIVPVLFGVYAIITTLSFISFVRFFDWCYALNPNYCCFFGGDNLLPELLVPACTVFILYLNEKKHYLFPMLLTALSVYTMFIAGSGTTVIVALAAALMFLPLRKLPIPNWLYLTGYAVMEAAVLIIPHLDNVERLQKIFDLVGKSRLFSGREPIWTEALKVIQHNPLFGTGRGSLVLGYEEMHNVILQLLIYGGIICLLAYLGVLYFATRRSAEAKVSSPSLIAIKHGIFLMFIDGLMEAIQDRLGLWILIGLLFVYDMKETEAKYASPRR